jgi:hypothetical protein
MHKLERSTRTQHNAICVLQRILPTRGKTNLAFFINNVLFLNTMRVLFSLLKLEKISLKIKFDSVFNFSKLMFLFYFQ